MKKKIKNIDKILIANRGEIAVRIIKTCKNMGIKTVAVYSAADTNAKHVQMADEAVYIGPSPAPESYLSIKNIIKAVRISGAQAVHPGYGFLSENFSFAKALKNEKVVLIGPSPDALFKMGDKIEAKKIANEADVNTIPGYMGTIESVDQAIDISRSIGFPVIMKAAAGGGGRGIRIINSEKEVEDAFRSTTNEAKNSFNDDRVFIEKYITNPRHIEIQVLADMYGNVLCLGERECSIQRHHQKVIEEAPSPFINEETRQKMYDQCRALALKASYYSAGTVEFIVDQDKNFYFLEMNTRLQVEHPVTELITKIDLIEQMIRIARQEELSLSQEDVQLNGWAMEARIYAEDPSRGFLPSSGRIIEYVEPKKSENIRVDTGVYEGGEVSMYYDAMIAKLCSYAPTREEAILHMQRGLGEYVIKGVAHNISFLQAVIGHPRYASGDISTRFIEEEYPEGFSGVELTSKLMQVFLCTTVHIFLADAKRYTKITGQTAGRSYKLGTRWVVTIDDVSIPVIAKEVEGGYNIRHEWEKLSVRSDWILGNTLFKGKINDEAVSVGIDLAAGGNYYLTHAGTRVKASVRTLRVSELEQFMPKSQSVEMSNEISAPISGMVSLIRVKEGDAVVAGQDLIVIEAMKMENIIPAPRNAKISKIHVREGTTIEVGQLILEFDD